MAGQNGARRVLVTGMPAVGKSTVCRLVAEGLDRSTVVEADVVREAIVGGFVEPEIPFSDAFIEQIRLQREIVNLWVDRMVAAGYHAVVDDAPIPPPPHFGRDYGPLLGHTSSLPVLLTGSREAIVARLEHRRGPFDEFFLERIEDAMDVVGSHDWTGWHVVDTTDLTPGDVAGRILDLF